MYARRLSRLSGILLIAFLAVALSAAYWSIFGADSLLARSDNPRLAEAEQAVNRGAIYDRQGTLLAQSVPAGNALSGLPIVERVYPYVDAISATGYYSLAGQTGVEDAFNTTLRGDMLTDFNAPDFNQLMHRAPVGSDLRLTIDLPIQQAAAQAMRKASPTGNPSGAVIVIDAQTGALRALLSLPDYDPAVFNDLTRFKQLAADPSAPLLNRALQGTYPPGSVLETVILSALIGGQTPLNQPLTNATQPISAAGLTLSCMQPIQNQTLQEAYAADCPAPFAQAAYDHRADVQQAINNFGLTQAPTIAGFSLPAPPHVQQLEAMPADTALIDAQGVGQGLLSVSPLQMALIAATIADHGQAQPLYIVEATRAPGGQWTSIASTASPAAVTSPPIADTIRQAMQYAVQNGTARAAAQSGMTIYGHAAIAYTGPNKTPIAWFIGFIDVPNGHSLAIAVTLENTADPSAAASVAGQVLKAAANESIQPIGTPVTH